ncbi:uncharacterized protein K02A2.6 isoform X1 [Leptinotarsa decemlineata]|uniref:uncharacterized protein K02A2.6 isoform X1 n=1 Tax=Leptinotarsa decemlineata TaxID=7539 RepID=UPI003D308A04
METFNVRINLVNALSINNEVNKVVISFPDLFSERLGKYKYSKVSLELKEDAKPVFCKHRNVPFAYKEALTSELVKLETEGVISPIETSEWATPIVIVMKSDKTLRVCGDYKVTVNEYLRNFKYPLPRIDEIFSKLSKGQHFSKIDLRSAYNQIELDEDTSKILTWNTHRGLYKVNRMPYGITPATTIFQKKIEQLLQGLDQVVNFIDDIVVTGSNSKEHLLNLEKVFQRLQNAGLTLKKSKCKFFQDSITYLGFNISKDGLKKVESKVKAILETDRPNNVSEVRSFIGFTNYYARFIPNLSKILHPIYQLLKKDHVFNWTDHCESSFKKLKEIISSDTTLVHFNPKFPILVTTDASRKGISAVLSHIIDGEERTVTCVSRTLLPSEKNYNTVHIEALAIYFAVNKFYQYVCGNEFILRTDHKPLVTIFGEHKSIPHMAASRLQRWATFLSMFDYKIQYIEGNNNPVADYLSRKPLLAKGNLENSTDIYINFTERTEDWPVDNAEVRRQTALDTELQKVIQYMRKDRWPKKIDTALKPYYHRRNELCDENGILTWGHRIIIPRSLREALLEELHTSHFGMVKMKTTARSLLYWPNIDRDIENMVRSCSICSENKQDPPKAPLTAWPLATKPFERVHIDFLGPIKVGMYFILTDSYSKWLEVYQMSTNRTSRKTEEVLRDIFSRFGLPETVVSDNGPQFVSENIKQFFTRNGILHITTPPYHAQSNGAAEICVKIFKNKFNTALQDPRNNNVEISTIISRILLTYRTSVHSSTGKTPYYLMFSRDPRTRLSQLKRRSIESSAEVLGEGNQHQNIHRKGCEEQRREFAEGKDIYIRMYQNQKKTWLPAKIVTKLGRSTYICQTPDNRTMKRHVNQIQERFAQPGENILEAHDDEACNIQGNSHSSTDYYLNLPAPRNVIPTVVKNSCSSENNNRINSLPNNTEFPTVQTPSTSSEETTINSKSSDEKSQSFPNGSESNQQFASSSVPTCKNSIVKREKRISNRPVRYNDFLTQFSNSD